MTKEEALELLRQIKPVMRATPEQMELLAEHLADERRQAHPSIALITAIIGVYVPKPDMTPVERFEAREAVEAEHQATLADLIQMYQSCLDADQHSQENADDEPA